MRNSSFRDRHLTILRNITRFCRTMFQSGSTAAAATLRKTSTESILPMPNICTLSSKKSYITSSGRSRLS